ncbi:CCA tRNA nucleotidyltransferase [Amycolatopsis sp. NPDC051071]|uniref:CCA tRNA nucleotidyltransferase n=1 Tax=Amycolatopsis sp. NPDC051071 TaxID=3154637 RepID=UPI0034451865
MQNAVTELMRISPLADELAKLFAKAGYSLYLVGGSVRDMMLGRPSNDLDFTTDARPDQVLKIVSVWGDAVWDVGIAFGTVGVTKQGMTLEITTFRADSYDRVGRNPEVTFGDSIEVDLLRRDFTVNAMAIDLGNKAFVDPHDGLRALRDRVLDTPATPQESFADDPLRMLRAARFSAQLGFTAAPRVVDAMTSMAEEIDRITAERVQAELSKLLLADDPRPGIELLAGTGLADRVLPEVPGMRLAIDEHHQHKDVYQHSLTVLEQAIDLEKTHEPTSEPDLILRLAALLHDIGKPATREFQPGGGVSFHHHEVVGAKMVRKRLRALKFSKEIVQDVSQLVFLHLRFHGYGKGEWTDSAVRRYVTDAGDLLPRLHKLVRADCTTRNRRKAAALQATYDDLEKRITTIQAQEDLDRVRPDLNGEEIMRILDLRPGPDVGKAWKFLKELRLDRGPLEHDDAVAELKKWAAENGIGG